MSESVKKNKYQMDMCCGPLKKQILIFAVPLVFSGLLQVLFNAADLVVVGRFASHHALAAVGSTTALTWLLINIFIGMSVATNVMTARYIGEKNRREASRMVHTSIFVSLVGGMILALVGIIFSRFFLKALDTPDDVLDMATLYMQIYFAGMPVIMFYNFGSAVLRAAGDTRRPFYFLMIGGVLNVLLNLFFVIVCKMDVAGVAIATVFSQAVAAWLILRVLYKMHDGCRFRWKKMRMHWKSLKEILYIGVPAGFQGSCFSLANILIQAAINSFGSAAVAGSTASVQWEGFFFVAYGAFGQTVVSFVGQNLGGKQYRRIWQSVKYCALYCTIFALTATLLLWIFSYQSLALFNENPEVVKWGILRYKVMLPAIWLGGLMEIFISALRGLGYSIGPSIIMIFGVCVFRIVWLWTVFKWSHTMVTLLLTLPISWGVIPLVTGIYFYMAMRKYRNM